MKTTFTKNQDNKLSSLLNSSCCPSLFDENMKDIPKRRNIRKARSEALSEASYEMSFPRKWESKK